MREAIRDIDRLHHIVECIGHIDDYLNGKSFEYMKANLMCYHAVVYNIMIIGEAANLLTKEFRDNHPEVPWRDIVDMRNVLVHGYITTNPSLIWDTYTNDLPLLKKTGVSVHKGIKQHYDALTIHLLLHCVVISFFI